MSRDKREPEYPAELESQFILRLPEEQAKNLREALRSGENLKSRLNIQIENDMRNGEVRLDNVVMQAKIVDLPTIIESLKTIDNKSFYKTADICQMMICKEDADPIVTEEESLTKSKKKDPYKVDKKFLWPHGITPPTKNVRKRRFRKTLKKKCIEAPEIEKEVKRLLRADNEAIKVTWEVINEEDEHQSIPETVHQFKSSKKDRKKSLERKSEKKSSEKKSSEKSSEKKSSEKKSSEKKSLESKSSEKSSESKEEKKSKGSKKKQAAKSKKSSNVVDIFGGAVSDSENEEHHINVDIDETRFSGFDSRLSVNSSLLGIGDTSTKRNTLPIEFQSQMFSTSHSSRTSPPHTVTSTITSAQVLSDDEDNRSQDSSKDSMTIRIEQVRQQLEELKSRRQRTQHEITGMENMALKQRFKDILHTLNQDVMYKEMEYQGLITLQNSEDI